MKKVHYYKINYTAAQSHLTLCNTSNPKVVDWLAQSQETLHS
ncbi:hypothetical protein ACFP3I_03640 [Chryseobacterium arachidis]